MKAGLLLRRVSGHLGVPSGEMRERVGLGVALEAGGNPEVRKGSCIKVKYSVTPPCVCALLDIHFGVSEKQRVCE